MAGTPGSPSGALTHRGLEQILKMIVGKPLNRAGAALLTLAFEVRKADHLSRGEKINEDDLKKEIKEVFYDLQGVTDPDIQLAQAQQKHPQPTR
jgi:hypothetical protein